MQKSLYTHFLYSLPLTFSHLFSEVSILFHLNITLIE